MKTVANILRFNSILHKTTFTPLLLTASHHECKLICKPHYPASLKLYTFEWLGLFMASN